MTTRTVSIIIDGQPVEARRDQTVMQAADAAGLYIPRLCNKSDLMPGGHCRLCTVLVNGRPASACTFPVTEGQVIESNSDRMNTHRRTLLEMLFVEGNHYCPTCEASGNCELQASAYQLGLLSPTLRYLRPQQELDATHKDMYLDRDRCILCGLCVRASRMIDGKNVFGFTGRGIHTRIDVDSEHGLRDTSLAATDRAAEICPTGCLVKKRTGYSVPLGQRLYDKTPIGSDIQHQTAAK